MRRYSGRFPDRFGACQHFLPHLVARQKQHIGMRITVISDQMFGSCDHSRDLRPILDESPDQKECRFDLMPRQDVEQALGMDVVWTVIESQGEMLGIAAMCQSLPIQL